MCTSYRQYKDKYGRLVYGPCKTCIECRNMRREDFSNRLRFQLMTYNYVGSFISLTYRDSDLPILLPEGSAVVGKYFGSCPPAFGSTLSRSDISNFCDKMQKRIKRKYGRSGKYIAVGEYGDDSHRPHFHIIYVGLPPDRKLVREVWSHGNVDVGPINKGAIRYVLNYIDKQVFGANALFEEYGDFQPPFAHFSKALGFDYIQKNIDKFDEYGILKYGDSGKQFQLNPYLRDKYNFKKKPFKRYSDSVIKYADEHNIKDLEKALITRSKVMKTKYEHNMIAHRIGLYDSDKIESLSAKGRYYMNFGEEYEKNY